MLRARLSSGPKVLGGVLRQVRQQGTAAAAPKPAPAAAPAAKAPPPPANPNKFKITIDGNEIEVEKGLAIIQACEQAGIEIPRFCYHQRLSVAGNCRMCLVEVEKARNPMASCAVQVAPGMKITTTSPRIKKAREGVMEFLLVNHPLDCPICDQGGECDLQDQSIVYGSDRSRSSELKRSVADKDIGPIVKTSMNRCIHCTRCIRFTTEVCGVEVLGTTGRGNGMEVGTYVQKLIGSEMSGNVADLCPVGALTQKPNAFMFRPWELRQCESVDVFDAMGCNITVNYKGPEVMRILPRVHEGVNEEWISDKARHACDGLRRQRLDKPMINGKPADWPAALMAIKAALGNVKGEEIQAVAGGMADVEAMVSLKDFVNRLGSSNTIHEDDQALSADIRQGYLFNTTIEGIEECDSLVLVGTQPRHEATILNSRIRKTMMHYKLDNVAHIGPAADFTFPYEHLGLTPKTLEDLASGKHAYSKVLAAAKKPMVIIGSGVLKRADAAYVAKLTAQLTAKFPALLQKDWNGFNILHKSASRVGALDVGFVAGPHAGKTAPKFVYLLGADNYDMTKIPDDAFVVYQGHHGDVGALRANVVLPGAAYTEKTATYVNLEGRVQRTRRAVPHPGVSREDWAILRALSEVCGVTLPYSTVEQLRARVLDIAPHMAHLDFIPKSHSLASTAVSVLRDSSAKAEGAHVPFSFPITNFYQADAISRNSPVMARCVKDGVAQPEGNFFIPRTEIVRGATK